MEPMHRPLLSIAPMIDITNMYCRYFLRLLTKEATLYTEMIHHNAILKTDPIKAKHVLRYSECQHPLVLQLGGCDPKQLSEASVIARELGYDQINLNVGCPSPRVQCGSFGACLMKQPELVADCLREMGSKVNIPCTVKCRLGVDDIETYDFTRNFVKIVSQRGNVRHFVVHARNAILNGLSPAQNRTIPPLKYEYVYKLQQDFPHLNFTLNGGIKTVRDAKNLLQTHNLHGCMIGRTVYENPWELATIDKQIYGRPSHNYTKREVVERYTDWADQMLQQQPTMSKPTIIKPLLNLFLGCKNNAKYRQYISDVNNFKQHESMSSLFQAAMEILDKTDDKYLQVTKYT